MTRVKGILRDNYRVENISREFHWFSDEPEEIGGLNTGPKPSELFLSALSSCKLITMRMYAERKDWDISDLTIDLQIIEVEEKVIISKKINFPDHLNEKQKNRLAEISGRCPVARMVQDSVEYIFV